MSRTRDHRAGPARRHSQPVCSRSALRDRLIGPAQLTAPNRTLDTDNLLQLVFNKPEAEAADAHATGELRSLAGLAEGEGGILEQLDLPEDAAQRLMALGFVPGCRVQAGRSAPGGDPRVYRVDGAEIALRAETAARLKVRCSEHGSCP